MSGVEGYVESAASGLLAGLNAAALATGQPVSVPPRSTAIGALAYYVSHADAAHYEPSNVTFGIMEPLAHAQRNGRARRLALSERALTALDAWMRERQALTPRRDAAPIDAADGGWMERPLAAPAVIE
jgi:methylenetetrahydrofolate--tRNA-(uracil-5-)-methyltransferase